MESDIGRRRRHRSRHRLLRAAAGGLARRHAALRDAAVRAAGRPADRRPGVALSRARRQVRARVEGRKVVPYWTRADIEAGHAPLDGKALVYVDDAVDAFFLEIQGSGR